MLMLVVPAFQFQNQNRDRIVPLSRSNHKLITRELGELGEESGEGGVAVDGDDAGVAAEVAELVVVGAGEDFAAEAAHETDALLQSRGGVIVEVGAWGGGEGIGGVGVEIHQLERERGRELRSRKNNVSCEL